MNTHRQRLEDCLSGERTDRIPVALWRHFPVDDQNPKSLADSILAFQNQFDFDLVKVTPASSYCLKDWGVEDQWLGATEGTREYSERIIQHPEDWEKLPLLDPTVGHLSEQIRCLEFICKDLGESTPVIQTIFNPLSQAKNLAGQELLLVHMRQYPEALQAGLRTITNSTKLFVEALLNIRIAGIFYAVQHAQYSLLSLEEYRNFGKFYDQQVLEPANEMWLNMLHLHGNDIMFDLFLDYPVQIINWHDRETWPSLTQAQSRFEGVVCGGLRREESLVLGNPLQIRKEAQEAAESTEGRRFIFGTGCVVPITAPYGNILAARQAVENLI